jgi:3-phenylpropionate/trans-cinnamate dioxygenase ferredoxin reductase subunit
VSTRRVDHLLIGGGIASATCAHTLREEGATGSILVVGRELDAPYHRPPVSKGYLQGLESRDDGLVRPAGWWEDAGVELLTRTSVAELDPAARRATLSTKDEVEFGTALVATGAMVRRLGVDGAQLEGIHYLRAPGNADALRRDIEDAERVVMVGGSYIGCEVAASLTTLGKRCTVVMLESDPLARHFGSVAGRYFRGVLEAHGVEVLGEEEVERFDGAGERVQAVITAGGRELPADAVVCGVGAIPDVMLARKAGLELGELGGVRCDERLETSAPGVFAAGDMCEYDSVLHGQVMRIEHEDHAERQGETVARNMLGAGVAHDVVPYFFSDLADWASLEYVGPALSWDQEIVRGSVDDGQFSVFYLDAGRVGGVLSVGRPDDLDEGRRLIASGEQVSGEDLARA